MIEMEPCPFCGSEPIFNEDTCIVYCPECGVTTHTMLTNGDPVKTWNTRSYIRDYAMEAEIRVMNGLAEQLEKARTRLGSGE